MNRPERQVEVFRVFEALRELAGLVESARAVPLSASCMVPRDHVLDLIEDIRDALPSELDDAQAVISAQDDLLARARERVERATERAESARERALAQARAEVKGMLAAAQQEAKQIVAAARAEHERLVSETEVHRAAAEEAERLLAEAHEEASRAVAEATAQAQELIAQAREETERLRGEADEYAEARLAALADTLARTLRTVEKGREALRERVAAGSGPRRVQRAASGTRQRPTGLTQ